ncbi:MOSC domain-containing protein [Caenimonas koreensis DSM 17982]|uniref:MOSC domain-containing protein n=1 Tax=Caenimonas koreensis DSM 17982 TaxID=1121255 RepID=A0A844B4K1_9BURK|nr:MOSC domain-containing protein [Caenimonas koreensis]MRD48142.1 MOSC domain-containing protein [Caenimonas koreensis DSM 17982]
MSQPRVVAVHASTSHSFSKFTEEAITLLEGLGVQGDTHAGVTVQHRSRVARDASQPNLRQVHLLHAELFDELVAGGFAVFPGDLGENITTRGLDVLALPTGTRLRIGADAIVEITGLRNPCSQIDKFQLGLTAAVLDRDAQGNLIRKAGVMGIVLQGGEVRTGDAIEVMLPALPHVALIPV